MAKWSDVKKELTSISEAEHKEIEFIAKLINRIIERRHQLGLTQKELGERAGFKQAYVARIENGGTLPRIDTLIRLALALDLELTVVPTDLHTHEEAATRAAG